MTSDTTTPLLSGVVQDPADSLVTGEFFLLTSSGRPIGGSPTGIGNVPSGTRISYQVPSGTLADGHSYEWYMKACYQGTCSRATARQHFQVHATRLGETGTPATSRPPSPPGPPADLSVTGGDGGATVTWDPPVNCHDGQDIASYTVKAQTRSGPDAASATVSGQYAVLTGLANGEWYKITVTATGTGGRPGQPARTFVRPRPVRSSAADIAAVRQFLSGKTQLREGGAATAAAAMRGQDHATAVTAQLTAEQQTDTGIRAAAAAADGAESAGVNTLSGLLAVPSGHRMVDVFASDDLTYTTTTGVGTSHAQHTASEDLTDYLFTFSPGMAGTAAAAGTSPQLTGYVDADAALDQINNADNPAAASTTLNDYANTSIPPGLVPPPGTNPPSGTAQRTAPRVAGPAVNQAGEVAYALSQWNGSTNGYGDDCTDFASRALNIGGGARFDQGQFSPFNLQDDHYWYRTEFFIGITIATYSWGGAAHLADHLWLRGNTYREFWSDAKPGDIIFANWNGSTFINLGNGAKDTISHTGVITAMSNGVPMITQHTNSRRNEPLWNWLATGPNVHVWIAIPNPS